MGLEYELKFRASPQSLALLRAQAIGQEREISMRTVYYDTPGGALAARKYTLRRREENGVSICTVKTPAGRFGRGEWEVPCADITEAIPLLCKLGCPADLKELTREGLIPVCGAEFHRIAKTLVFPEFTAELALDSGVLTGGSRSVPLCEAEVELKSGDAGAMRAYAKDLAARYTLLPETKSKFSRALRLYKGEDDGLL